MHSLCYNWEGERGDEMGRDLQSMAMLVRRLVGLEQTQ